MKSVFGWKVKGNNFVQRPSFMQGAHETITLLHGLYIDVWRLFNKAFVLHMDQEF